MVLEQYVPEQFCNHPPCWAGFEKFPVRQGQQDIVKQHVFDSDQLPPRHEDNSQKTLSIFPIIEQGFCDTIQNGSTAGKFKTFAMKFFYSRCQL